MLGATSTQLWECTQLLWMATISKNHDECRSIIQTFAHNSSQLSLLGTSILFILDLFGRTEHMNRGVKKTEQQTSR